MITRIVFYILLLFCVFSSLIKAQERAPYYPQPEHPEWFKAIPLINEATPEWARYMYKHDSQFEKIEELREEFYADNPFEKNLHTQNHKYWVRQVQGFVEDDGMVRMPKPGEQFLHYENLKNQKDNTADRISSTSWANIGPYVTFGNGDSEKRPTQANVYCLGVAPSNHNVVYAGMETGGIYKSIDKGLNWFPVSEDYAIGNIHDIKVDPLNENIVYASRGQELYKTTDGGSTWSLHYVAAGFIEQFYIHSTVTDTIYAATRSGLLKSSDGGSSWSTIFTGYIYDIEAKPGTNDTFYISIRNDVAKRPEIFKSIDNGNNWTLMDNGYYSPTDLSVANVYGCKIGVTPADPERLYAGIIATGKAGDNGWIGVYYSLDGGANWQEDSGFDGGPYEPGNDMNTNWYVAGYSSGYHQGWYNFDIDVSHTDPDKLWIGTIWFCESGNKGGNIEYIRGTRSLSMHADIQDIDVVGNDIWVASDGGINYSNDECQTMETRMDGITASDFWGFGMGWNEDTWVGGRYHNGNGAFHENYGVGNTTMLGGAEAPTGYINPFDSRKTHFTDITDKRLSTSLSESSPNIPNLGLYPNQSYFHFGYSEMEWHPYYANVIYVGNGSSLHVSKDGGANFEVAYTFPGSTRRFEISRSDPNYIYMIVEVSGSDWRVYKSTDGGNSFSQLTSAPYSSGSWNKLSLTINPFDENDIWLASHTSDNGNKIFQSLDGGNSWANKYSSVIAGQKLKDLIYHASPDGDMVYAMSEDNFFHYDIDASQWTTYNSGLPVLHRGFMMLPFYRDEKIRMASAKGIWEVPFLRPNKVQAIPMATQDTAYCSRDTVYLENRSIVNATGASWQWAVTPSPSYVSSLTDRNPKVVFGEDGLYDIGLTVTDANNETDTKTVDDMVSIISQCEADTIPGKSLRTFVNGDYAVAQEVNLTNITHFSMTGWWKADGAQQGFAALASSGDWCAHCDYTEGLIVSYFGDKLWYKWPGNSANWGSNSGMTIPLDEWSFVALTIEPDKATLYLNEQKFEHNIPLQPGDITNLYLGYGHYSKSFKGDIDEVTIWKRTLTEEEIRLMRHLTKEGLVSSDPDLIAYYQFNELVNETNVMDHAGTFHAIMNSGAQLASSNAPVGGGVSEKFTVNGTQTIQSLTGLDLTFSSSGTYPDGEIVLTRINQHPDTSPGPLPISRSYWVLNNYGSNNSFSSLSAMSFNSTGILTPFGQDADYQMTKRGDNESGPTWNQGDYADDTDLDLDIVTFSQNLGINSSGQFTIMHHNAIGWLGLVNSDWNEPANWGGGQIPTGISEVIIPAMTPFQPVVDLDVFIQSILLQPSAKLTLNNGHVFTVK